MLKCFLLAKNTHSVIRFFVSCIKFNWIIVCLLIGNENTYFELKSKASQTNIVSKEKRNIPISDDKRKFYQRNTDQCLFYLEMSFDHLLSYLFVLQCEFQLFEPIRLIGERYLNNFSQKTELRSKDINIIHVHTLEIQ